MNGFPKIPTSNGMPMPLPLERLKHHVTGAIERGEKMPIVSIPAFKKDDRVSIGQSPYVFYVVASDSQWTTLRVPGYSEQDAIFEVRTKHLGIAGE